MHTTVVREVKLDAQFGHGIWRFRILGVDLGVGRRVEITVENAAGGRKYDARIAATCTHRLHQVERANDVDGRVVHGIRDAFAHVHLRSEVCDHIELSFAHQSGKLVGVDTDVVEL